MSFVLFWFAAIVLLIVAVLITRYVRYLAIPTLQEYLSRHPECRTGRGLKCFQCGSQSIRNWGLEQANSSSRIHICNHCGLKLYRTS